MVVSASFPCSSWSTLHPSPSCCQLRRLTVLPSSVGFLGLRFWVWTSWLEAQKADVWERGQRCQGIYFPCSLPRSLLAGGIPYQKVTAPLRMVLVSTFCILITAPSPHPFGQEVVRALGTALSFVISLHLAQSFVNSLFINLSQMILHWIRHLFPAGTWTDRVVKPEQASGIFFLLNSSRGSDLFTWWMSKP